MTEHTIAVLAVLFSGIGGFFMGYGWAAWLERWSDS